MKPKFLTIEIDGKCFDLPKDMQIPEKGSVVHVGGLSGIIDTVNYHIVEKRVYTVSLYATKT